MVDRPSVYTIPGSFHAVEKLWGVGVLLPGSFHAVGKLWRTGLLFTLEMIFSAHILCHFRRGTLSKMIRYKREKLLLQNLNLKWSSHLVSSPLTFFVPVMNDIIIINSIIGFNLFHRYF